MAKVTCCWHCPDRCVTEHYNCHTHCQKYLEQSAENEERLQASFKYNQLEAQYKDSVIKAVKRGRKRYHGA